MIDDDEAYGLRCDIGRLEQENATLRQQLEDVTESMGRVEERCAKLRELVRKLYGGYMGGHYVISCRGCEHAYEDYGGDVPIDPDYCVYRDSDRYVGCWKRKQLEVEMRELGVKVV